MTLNKVLPEMIVMAVAAALTAAGTSYLLSRYAISGSAVPAARVQKIVHGYLINNPEILIAMSSELEKRRAIQEQALAADHKQTSIADNAEALFRSPTSYVAGNPNGDVSVVEFFDYNCGYCREALPGVVKLINDDGKVRLVLKELPIFGKGSLAASKLALAAQKQGKYFEMHQNLFTEPGPADEAKALRIAQELGLDTDRLKNDAQAPEIEKTLDDTKALARKVLGSPLSTPYYLVGDRRLDTVSENFVDELKAKVAEVRQKGCASC